MHASADNKIIPTEKSLPVEAPCAKPHPRILPRRPPARSSYILAEVALRRKQHKHNAVELVDHTRRTYAFTHSLTNARTYARIQVHIRFAFAYTHAYHSKNSTRLSTRRDIALRGGRKMPIDKANKWINERFLA